MRKFLFKIQKKENDEHLKMLFLFVGQISKTEIVKTFMGVVSASFTAFAVIQHYIH